MLRWSKDTVAWSFEMLNVDLLDLVVVGDGNELPMTLLQERKR